jgi:hypothetical protein
VLDHAHETRPEEFPAPDVVHALSDWALLAYSRGIVARQEETPGDSVALGVADELRRILDKT